MRYIRFDANFEFEDDDLTDATRRKQVFREIVKDIRGSNPTDVNGAIARAIELAFKAGVDMGQRDPDFQPNGRRQKSAVASNGRKKPSTSEKNITMIDVPPRARDALATLALFANRSPYDRGKWKGEIEPILLKQMPADPWGDKQQWLLIRPTWPSNPQTFGPTTLSGLQKLGLLVMESSGRYLTLSARGVDLILNERTSTAVSDKAYWSIRPQPEADVDGPAP